MAGYRPNDASIGKVALDIAEDVFGVLYTAGFNVCDAASCVTEKVRELPRDVARAVLTHMDYHMPLYED